MKKYLFGLVAISAVAAIGIAIYGELQQPKYVPQGLNGNLQALGIADGNAEYMRMLRGDKDGNIDHNKVIKSRNAVKQYRASKNQASDIYWESLGPNFVGGRARALLQDNQVPNSAVWYAGSVSGGVFITYDGGNQWFTYNSDLTDLATSSLAQTPNGTLFVAGSSSDFETSSGSGTNRESGFPGDGLFKRVVDGNGGHTFDRIIGPSAPNQTVNKDWRIINRIQAHPTDDNRLYVGGNTGLQISNNAQSSEMTFFTPTTSIPISGAIDEIVVNNDGSEFYVVAGASIFHFQDNGAENIVELNRFTIPGGSGSIGRITLAIAPSNDSVMYASIANQSSCLYGIFQSRDKGTTWTNIGPGGTSFDPFSIPGIGCQGIYDNAIAVYPHDDGKIIVGGISLWEWNESATTPGTGGWTQIAVTQGGGLFDRAYVHADKHRIRIPTPNDIWIASDGGIGRSIDGGQTWFQSNNGFNVTQFYSVSSAMGVEFEVNGVEYVLQQVMGGSQDNGTQLIGTNPERPIDPVEVSGGDGFDCAFSNLANQAYTTVYYGSISRVSIINPQGQSLYDAELASLCGDPFNNPCASFFTRIAYFETARASSTLDSIKVFAKTTVNIGDTLNYFSEMGSSIPMAWPSYRNLVNGDSIMMPDFAQSRLVMATNNGIYMTRDAAHLGSNNFEWDLIAGASSFPDALSGGVNDMKFSGDGNQLFAATRGGTIFRIDNLNQGNDSLSLDIRSGQSVLTCTRIASLPSGNRGSLNRIAVDPNNANNLVAVCGGYENENHVFYLKNAATGLASVSNIQGDLPFMPVYCAIIGEHDANVVMVGTEFATYITENAQQGGTASWKPCGNGMPIVPVHDMTQQTEQFPFGEDVDFENLNYRKIYLGTHGRGFYVTDDLVGIDDIDPGVVASVDHISLDIYPNPAREKAIVSLDLKGEENMVVEVYDLSGKIIATVKNGTMNAGKQLLEFNVSNWNNGTYLVSARSDSERKVAKLVVLK